MRAIRHIANDEVEADEIGVMIRIIPFEGAECPDANRLVFETARIFHPRHIAIRIRPIRPRFAGLGPRKLKTLDVFDPDDIVVIESS